MGHELNILAPSYRVAQAMPDTLPAGPYRSLVSPEGDAFPYYLLTFDEEGACTAPKTRTHLLAQLGDVTDLFVFSHGWNNDWTAATDRYEHFIEGVQKLRVSRNLAMPTPYRPLLVGIFWPSQSMEWFDSEKGPAFAGSAPDTASADALRATIDDIARFIPENQRTRFREMAAAESLSEADAAAFAEMLAATLNEAGDTEAGAHPAPAAEDLIAAAHAMRPGEIDLEQVGRGR